MQLLLADDHGLFRESMAEWLKQLDENLLIDFAGNQKEVKQKLSVQSFDIVMLDLGMPGMQGAFSVKQFCKQLGSIPLVVVSADENPLTIRSCIEAGAAGYVCKSSDGKSILQAIRQVLSGMAYIPLKSKFNNDEKSVFNNKQLHLLALLAEGYSNKDIAETMHLSLGTVKQYVTHILKLLDVDNRVQAALKARNMLGISDS